MGVIATALQILGVVAIVVALLMIYVPLGIVAGGVALLIAGYLLEGNPDGPATPPQP